MRVLGRIRLSRVTDETTSPERQREIIESWASANDHTIVGWAEDLDVSGSMDPFETPELGQWLRQPKMSEWDILCAWRLDRVARRAIPLHKLFGFCMDEKKTLVCVSDNIDLSTWVGRLVASVIAGVAEGELEAIRERTKASVKKLRELGRYAGGKALYGYRPEQHPDGGWSLVPDDEVKPILEEIIERTIAGQSLNSIALDLTSRGIPTPDDYQRIRSGKAPRGATWAQQTLHRFLKSPSMLGHTIHQDRPVLDDEGELIMKAEPLVSQHTYDQLQLALRARPRSGPRKRTTGASPLLGVALCLECEMPLYLKVSKHRDKEIVRVYRYYRCRDGHGQLMVAETVELLLETAFLDEVGDVEVCDRVFIPAEDHQNALEAAVASVDELSSLLGTLTSNTAKERVRKQMKALDFKIAELEQLPESESRFEYRPTGKLYREVWEQSDEQERRQLLLKSGITATVFLEGKVANGSPGSFTFHLRVPEQVQQRLS
jgi:site-specific DNA recombinase